MAAGTLVFAFMPAPAREALELTAEQTEAVQSGIRETLIDPDSARFSGLIGGWSDDPELAFYVCGWVNSKNRFGGYAGRQAFLATLSGQRTETEPYRLKVYQLHEFSDHTTGLCRRIGLDMAAGGGTGR